MNLADIKGGHHRVGARTRIIHGSLPHLACSFIFSIANAANLLVELLRVHPRTFGAECPSSAETPVAYYKHNEDVTSEMSRVVAHSARSES